MLSVVHVVVGKSTAIASRNVRSAVNTGLDCSICSTIGAIVIKPWILNPGNLMIRRMEQSRDRKSTRLNSSHQIISYAVFCLKKKKTTSRDERFCVHYRIVHKR